MKSIFEEYGKVILVLIISTLLIVFIFSGMRLLDLLGVQADVDSEVSISNGDGAFATIVSRERPKVSVVADKDNKTLYKNIAFQPVSMVECKDADGNILTPVVTSIVLNSYKLDSDGSFVLDANGNRVSEKTEMIDYYNKEEDVIVLNPSHYSDSHKKCLKSEFSGDNLEITKKEETEDEVHYNLPGSVVVTYKAVDGDKFKGTAVSTVAFVIDNHLLVKESEAFQPLRYIDDDEMYVSSIIFTHYIKNASGEYELDGDRNRKTERIELFEHYNSSEDVIILNPSHYSDSHKKCSEDEFTDNLEIKYELHYNLPGSVVVTYKPTSDGEDEGLTSKTIVFTVDD